MDGIAAVQARIAQIQQRFVAPPAISIGADFAPVLADAQSTVEATAPVPSTGRARAFVDEAMRQAGDPYVWGSSASPTDANPDAFDCSELTRWAAQRVGIDIPDGSWLQYLDLKEKGALVPVEEAMRTPGALLFGFSEEPKSGGGRPDEAHVAISLGDGRTIEARGRKYGVGTFEAADRFQYGAIIPGL
ncbi:MAG: C40 family peptidase [Actinomycetota bacterium]